MNIFFIHGVSSFGGSTKSLIELYTQLKLHGINGTVLCPYGYSEQMLSESNMKTYKTVGVSQFDNTLFGYYRKLRWLILLREFVFIIPTLLALITIKIKEKKFDIIHANEITLLPVAIIAKKIFKCPLIVHVRSVQRGYAKDFRTKALFNLLYKYADSIIAIDETVKNSLPKQIRSNVIHNGINLPENFLSLKKVAPEITRVGIVGTLIRLKGVYELIDAARILLNERKLEIEFIIVGENARKSNGITGWIYKKLGFSDNIENDILKFIKSHQIEKSFVIKGFVKDIRTIYSNLDILCFPSYLNAAGRPVFEAALFSIPSIVAITNPAPDTIINNETGICIKKSCSLEISDAIEYLVRNPQERIRLGNNAQKLALNNFDIKENAKKINEIYKLLLTQN